MSPRITVENNLPSNFTKLFDHSFYFLEFNTQLL